MTRPNEPDPARPGAPDDPADPDVSAVGEGADPWGEAPHRGPALPEATAGDPTGSPVPAPEPRYEARRRPLAGLLALLLLAAAGPAAVLWVRPPPALAEDASPTRFSAHRAARHLEWIASEPRPVGSPRHAAVRERLVAELRSLGLEVELQEGSLPGSSDAAGEPLVLSNVLARLPGERADTPGAGSGDALLLLAHYDSVPLAPGAGDDGAAVAALLETLRALRTDAPRWNDLFVLVTDGEERGLLGARLFVEQRHPWLDETGAVLNFEARGAGGPSILFQVGARSGALVQRFAAVAEHPFGTSLAPAVYEELPNDTDFTVFREAGARGLNFAFIGGGRAYHGPGDTPGALDLGSLQQHGEAMLALARDLANRGPSELDEAPEQEFLLLPGLRLRWPLFLTTPLVVGVLVGALVFLLARGRAEGSRVRAGFLRALPGAAVALLVAGAGAATAYYAAVGLHLAMDALGVAPDPAPGSNLRAGEWLAGGAWLVVLGVATFFVALVGRGRDRTAAARRLDALGAGALLLFAPAALVLAVRVPGAGHVGLFTAGAVALTLFLCGPRRPRPSETYAASQPLPDPTAGGPRALAAVLVWVPAGIALLPLLALLVQVGSREPLQERVLGAAVAALATLSALPVLAVVAARRERAALLVLLLGLVALGIYAWSDLAVA